VVATTGMRATFWRHQLERDGSRERVRRTGPGLTSSGRWLGSGRSHGPFRIKDSFSRTDCGDTSPPRQRGLPLDRAGGHRVDEPITTRRMPRTALNWENSERGQWGRRVGFGASWRRSGRASMSRRTFVA
jgi:hypothetical protein